MVRFPACPSKGCGPISIPGQNDEKLIIKAFYMSPALSHKPGQKSQLPELGLRPVLNCYLLIHVPVWSTKCIGRASISTPQGSQGAICWGFSNKNPKCEISWGKRTSYTKRKLCSNWLNIDQKYLLQFVVACSEIYLSVNLNLENSLGVGPRIYKLFKICL